MQTHAKSYTCPKCHRTSHNPNDVAHMYCGYCHAFAEDLRNEVVTEFADICAERLTKKDGFSLALLTLARSDNPEGRLVHAFVRNSFDPGEFVEHAWCEFPADAEYEDGSKGPITVAVDYTQLDERVRFMPRDEYYAKVGVKVETIRRYTQSESLTMARIAGMDGPWLTSPT